MISRIYFQRNCAQSQLLYKKSYQFKTYLFLKESGHSALMYWWQSPHNIPKSTTFGCLYINFSQHMRKFKEIYRNKMPWSRENVCYAGYLWQQKSRKDFEKSLDTLVKNNQKFERKNIFSIQIDRHVWLIEEWPPLQWATITCIVAKSNNLMQPRS